MLKPTAIRSCTDLSIIQSLLHCSTHHGLPLTIVTGNRTEFTNQLFTEFTQLYIIQRHRSILHSPNDCGNIEWFHSTSLEHLRLLKLKQKREPVISLMPYTILAYNSSEHSFTKCRLCNLSKDDFDPRDPIDVDVTKHNTPTVQQNLYYLMLLVIDFFGNEPMKFGVEHKI